MFRFCGFAAVPAYCCLPALCLLLALPRAVHAAGIEGFIEPYRKIDVGPSEPGLLARLNVHEGDTVEAGQVLGTLECDVLEVSLQIAEAAMQSQGRINSALAECELHKARLEKLTELLAQGHANHEEVEHAKTELAVAQANLQTAREQQAVDRLEYKKIAAMIERRKLRSPLAGVVTRIYKDEQELIAGNSSIVLTVVQLNPLRVTFSVPTAQGLTMKAGQSLPLVLPETSEKLTGMVELVSPVTEAESGTVRVKVLIDNVKGSYRSGVRCALEQPEAEKKAAAEAPAAVEPTPEVGVAQ